MWVLFATLAVALAQEPVEPIEVAQEPTPREVRVQIDWQSHPAMHIPWFMFGKGLTDRPLTRRTWRHRFRQTVSAQTLGDSEVRIYLAAAMAAERARNPKQARRLILKQLRYVEHFVSQHPERYALAKTPAEARRLLTTTHKMVILHSIEGGHHLLWEPQDAQRWADLGVVLFTLIHLRDKEFGGAALRPGRVGRLINPAGARAQRRGERRGLTDHGKASILALHEAGILVDYSHMSPDALSDALELSQTHRIPPILTHSRLGHLFADLSGVSEEQLVQIYRLGGQFALSLNALDVGTPQAPTPLPPDVCPGTLQAWAWQHHQVHTILLNNIRTIFDDPTLTPETLSDTQRTQLATGWSSDWNGWTSHSRPVYGKGECHPELPSEPLAVDTRGLAHPGLLPEHWQRVEERGVTLEPMLRSAERFLQLWEHARGDTSPSSATD